MKKIIESSSDKLIVNVENNVASNWSYIQANL